MKINLHCHTNFSDGVEPVSVMMLEHKKQGFSAFVVTDHYKATGLNDPRIRTIHDFQEFTRQRKELISLSNYLDYPWIQGIELFLGKEEVLLFGYEVIKEVFKFVENYGGESIYHDIIKFLKERKNRCAVVMCHPRCEFLEFDEFKEYYEDLFDICDGYESFNCGTDWINKVMFFTGTSLPERMLIKKDFRNSDAHCLDHIKHGNNSHERPIYDEQGLIKYIKGVLK